MSKSFFAAIAASAIVCSGCAQNGATTVPQSRPAAATAGGLASVTFVMQWPSSSTGQAAKARPDFISGSTQSVSVQVNSLTPVIVNKPTSGSAPTSNIVIAAPSGTDLISFKIYDQQNGTGNLLGEAAVSQSISATAANTVSATINGILSKIAIAPAPNQPFVEGNAVSGFVLVGEVAETFIATPEDVDGNVIIAPGIVPTLTLASTTPAVSVTSGTTANQFIVKTVSPQAGAFALVATGRQNTVTQSVPISQSAAIYVPNSNSIITVYDQNGVPIIPTGKFANLEEAASIAFNPATGYLYVLDVGSQTVSVFDQNGNTVTTSGKFPNMDNPLDVAFAPSTGRVFVVNSGNNTITIYDSNGNLIETSSDSTLDNPTGIAYDPADNLLYVTNEASNTVNVYNQDGVNVGVGTIPKVAYPFGIRYDSVRNEFYVLYEYDSEIEALQANGSPVTLSGGFPNIIAVNGLAFDPVNDEVYVSNDNDGFGLLVYDQDGTPISTIDFSSSNAPAAPIAIP